ncbi:hypothetical protein BT69DRAFT_1358935 [Atractiella rhizophila]|nr:hypothetical protein BT69DRAFT_1358935 [Atractiella rhizophila]
MAASGGAQPISLSNLQSAGGGGGGEGVFGIMEGVGRGARALPSLIGASPRKKAKTQKRKAATSGNGIYSLNYWHM